MRKQEETITNIFVKRIDCALCVYLFDMEFDPDDLNDDLSCSDSRERDRCKLIDRPFGLLNVGLLRWNRSGES